MLTGIGLSSRIFCFCTRKMVLILHDHNGGVDNHRKQNETDDVGSSPDNEGHKIHLGHLGDVDVMRTSGIKQQTSHCAAPHGRCRCRRSDAGTQ